VEIWMATSNFSSLFKEVEGNYWNLGCIHSPTGPLGPSGGPSRSFPAEGGSLTSSHKISRGSFLWPVWNHKG
jgi:hypothetical protein